jgi:hypothetical protein
LDAEQEKRSLTQDELVFRRYLKAKSVQLAAIQRSRARQHSRLTWLREGDACTKLFMLHANNRRRKIFIPTLKRGADLAVSQQSKEEMVYNHFVNLMGKTQTRTASLHWAHFGYQQHNLQDLEDQFDEEEIKKIIMRLPNEKAPGPDGFIRLFYKKCWNIIKFDLMEALGVFHSLRTRNWI